MYSPASLLNPLEIGASQIGAPILYVVRHAQNDDDAQGKIRGLKDQALNENGEKQLKELADFFDSRPVAAIITDDLSRTRATALAIAGVSHVQVETDLGLRSWDLGKLEGKSMAAHKLEISEFKTHPDKVPVGGQSWGEFEDQARAALSRIIRWAMTTNAPVAIVTHGSVIQIFFQTYGDWPGNCDYDCTPLDQTGVAALYLTREGYEVKSLRGEKPVTDA